MKTYEAKVLNIPEKHRKYFQLQFSKENVVTILEQLNVSSESADTISENLHGFIANEYTLFELHKAVKAEDLQTIFELLENVKLEVIEIDKCQLIRLRQSETDPLNEVHTNWLRTRIGPHRPELVKGSTISIIDQNGKRLELLTWDIFASRQLDQIYNRFQQWLIEQKGNIGPQFERIKNELGNFLLEESEGIVPQKDSFVDWFVSSKLTSLEFEIRAVVDKDSNWTLPEGCVPVRLEIKNLTKLFSTDVIIAHLFEYVFWYLDQARIARDQGRNAFLEAKAKRALSHQVNTETTTDATRPNLTQGSTSHTNTGGNELKKKVISPYSSFKDLFINPDDVDPCVKALLEAGRRNKRIIISATGQWNNRKGNISILIAWLDALKQNSKLRTPFVDDKILSKLLNEYFEGLQLDTSDASIFRKATDIRNQYHPVFLQLIR